jgi:hypothetical protein
LGQAVARVGVRVLPAVISLSQAGAAGVHRAAVGVRQAVVELAAQITAEAARSAVSTRAALVGLTQPIAVAQAHPIGIVTRQSLVELEVDIPAVAAGVSLRTLPAIVALGAPYQYVEHQHNSTGSSVTSLAAGAFDANVIVGQTIVVFVRIIGGTEKDITVSDSQGNTYTRVSPAGAQFAHTYIAPVTSAGADDVTASWAGGTQAAIVAEVFSGLDAFDGYSLNTQASPGAGADAITSGNITPGEQPAVLIGLSQNTAGAGGTAPNAGTGFTSRGAVWDFEGLIDPIARLEDRRLTATDAVAATFTRTAAESHETRGLIILEG